MYGVVTNYKWAKLLYDLTPGRAVLRFIGIDKYMVLSGPQLDRMVK
jgi:hypothetical protein